MKASGNGANDMVLKAVALAVIATGIGIGCAAVAAAQDGPYKVTKIQLVGGDGAN